MISPSKKKGSTLSTNKYQEAVKYFSSYNPYLSHFSKMIYFSKKFEIDAYANGAYNSVKNKNIEDYETFIEQTELKYVKEILESNINFFKHLQTNTLEFYKLLDFIERNKFFKFKDIGSLKNKLVSLSEKTYDYFLKKTARTWIKIIQDRKEKLNTIKESNNLLKWKQTGNTPIS